MALPARSTTGGQRCAYHSDVDEGRQQPAGLIGAIIVLGPGQRYDPASDLLAVISSPPDSADETRAVLINGVLEPRSITLRAGGTYRLRMINITTARPGTRVELRSDSALTTWRRIAQDGADLPAERRVVEPSARRLRIGQTLDVEVAPVRPGEMRLRIVGNAGDVLGTLSFRVER